MIAINSQELSDEATEMFMIVPTTIENFGVNPTFSVTMRTWLRDTHSLGTYLRWDAARHYNIHQNPATGDDSAIMWGSNTKMRWGLMIMSKQSEHV